MLALVYFQKARLENMASGTRFVDKQVMVPALHATVPSGSSPKWVSLRGYNHVQAAVIVTNAAGVTGSAITLNQASAVNGANSKALGFSAVWASTDIANSVALTNTAVVSNTFTTTNTSSAIAMYLIEVNASTLDVANGFTSFQVGTGNATNATVSVIYTLGDVPFYAGGYNSFVNSLAN